MPWKVGILKGVAFLAQIASLAVSVPDNIDGLQNRFVEKPHETLGGVAYATMLVPIFLDLLVIFTLCVQCCCREELTNEDACCCCHFLKCCCIIGCVSGGLKFVDVCICAWDHLNWSALLSAGSTVVSLGTSCLSWSLHNEKNSKAI